MIAGPICVFLGAHAWLAVHRFSVLGVGCHVWVGAYPLRWGLPQGKLGGKPFKDAGSLKCCCQVLPVSAALKRYSFGGAGVRLGGPPSLQWALPKAVPCSSRAHMG